MHFLILLNKFCLVIFCLLAGFLLSKHFFIGTCGPNPQFVFDNGQEMTTSNDGRIAEFKAKFYNLLAEKKGAKHGKNIVSLTKATYDEILVSLSSINTGTLKPSEKDRYEMSRYFTFRVNLGKFNKKSILKYFATIYVSS